MNPYRERAFDVLDAIRTRLGNDPPCVGAILRRDVEVLLLVAEAALTVGTAEGSPLDRAISELGASR